MLLLNENRETEKLAVTNTFSIKLSSFWKLGTSVVYSKKNVFAWLLLFWGFYSQRSEVLWQICKQNSKIQAQNCIFRSNQASARPLKSWMFVIQKYYAWNCFMLYFDIKLLKSMFIIFLMQNCLFDQGRNLRSLLFNNFYFVLTSLFKVRRPALRTIKICVINHPKVKTYQELKARCWQSIHYNQYYFIAL